MKPLQYFCCFCLALLLIGCNKEEPKEVLAPKPDTEKPISKTAVPQAWNDLCDMKLESKSSLEVYKPLSESCKNPGKNAYCTDALSKDNCLARKPFCSFQKGKCSFSKKLPRITAQLQTWNTLCEKTGGNWILKKTTRGITPVCMCPSLAFTEDKGCLPLPKK